MAVRISDKRHAWIGAVIAMAVIYAAGGLGMAIGWAISQ